MRLLLLILISVLGLLGAVECVRSQTPETPLTSTFEQRWHGTDAPPSSPPSVPHAIARKNADPATAERTQQPTGRLLGRGRASWYEKLGRTASGEDYDPDSLTAAHVDLPLGSRVRIVNLRNRQSIVVRINDRISAKQKKVVINLSRGSAHAIGMRDVGSVEIYAIE